MKTYNFRKYNQKQGMFCTIIPADLIDEEHPAFGGATVREHVLAEYYHTLAPCRMPVDDQYKYIHTEEDICELYDLVNDPGVAWYPQYAARVEQYDRIVMDDWEIPELPVYAPWNDLSERKQKQRLAGLDITDVRPPLPTWAEKPKKERA